MTRGAYYNEHDPYAAQWLRNLIAADHIAPGEVDERSIEDVCADDLRGFAQCHFFAGIGVWSYALRQVGWPDDAAVWTGSCPCQPFSAAGESGGFADERHLWPAWYQLIIQCRPNRIYGEQVASKLADAWIDLVQDDLEAMGYAVGAVPFPSASVGAPHIRDRLYWMADALGERHQGHANRAESLWRHVLARCGDARGLVDTDVPLANERGAPSGQQPFCNGYGAIGETASSRMAYADGGRIQETGRGSVGRVGESGTSEECRAPGPVNGFWRNADWITCRDGLWRPVEPGTFPLANGVANRMDKLRAFGNAINARQAIEFIKATL